MRPTDLTGQFVLTGTAEGHIADQSRLTIFEPVDADHTSRHYSPVVDFLRSADIEGPLQDNMLAYQVGIRQGFFIMLKELNLLDHGCQMTLSEGQASGRDDMSARQKRLRGPDAAPIGGCRASRFEFYALVKQSSQARVGTREGS